MTSMLSPQMSELLESRISRIPEGCRQGLLDYLRYGIPPGHFLEAVLSNDLRAACGRADEHNRYWLYEYIVVLHNYAPAGAWGSPEYVADWIKQGAELRAQCG